MQKKQWLRGCIYSLLFLFLGQVKAQVYALVKIRSNDCINCILGGKEIANIDPRLATRFLAEEGEQKLLKTLVKQHYNYELSEDRIFTDAALRMKLDSIEAGSAVYIMHENETIYSCPLSQLNLKIKELNSYATGLYTLDSIAIDSNFVYSKRSQLCVQDSLLYIYDYVLNQISLLSLQGQEYRFQAKLDLSREKLATRLKLEDISKWEATLKKIGQDKALIGSLSLRADTLEFLCGLPFIRLSEKQSLDVDMQVFLLQYKGLECIGAYALANQVNEEYFIEGVGNIHSKGNSIFLSVAKEKLKKENALYAEYKFEKDSLVFQGLAPYLLPPDLRKNGAYDFAKSQKTPDILFFEYSAYYYLGTEQRQIPIRVKNSLKKKIERNFRIRAALSLGQGQTAWLIEEQGQLFYRIHEQGKDWKLSLTLPFAPKTLHSSAQALGKTIYILGEQKLLRIRVQD